MSQSLSQLYVHIVFHINCNDDVTIPEKLQNSMHAYIAVICKNQDSSPILVGGIDDHVHLLCRLSKNITTAKLLEEIKTNSSKWIKTQANDFNSRLNKFSWQKG